MSYFGGGQTITSICGIFTVCGWWDQINHGISSQHQHWTNYHNATFPISVGAHWNRDAFCGIFRDVDNNCMPDIAHSSSHIHYTQDVYLTWGGPDLEIGGWWQKANGELHACGVFNETGRCNPFSSLYTGSPHNHWCGWWYKEKNRIDPADLFVGGNVCYNAVSTSFGSFCSENWTVYVNPTACSQSDHWTGAAGSNGNLIIVGAPWTNYGKDNIPGGFNDLTRPNDAYTVDGSPMDKHSRSPSGIVTGYLIGDSFIDNLGSKGCMGIFALYVRTTYYSEPLFHLGSLK